MKIKPDHFEHLKKAVSETLAIHNANGELVAAYERGEFHNSDKTQDLQKRFCFDVLYGAGLTKFVCDTLYSYLNDEHIYTALRAICPVVKDPRCEGRTRFSTPA